MAGVALLLLTGCTTPLTASRLGGSVAETYAGLYATQQALLGRTDVQRTQLQPVATCRRTGTVADGPGEDWSCTAEVLDGGTPVPQSFEVQLKADGCWKAEGPPATQPAQLVDPRTGAGTTNPLAEFDGCVDTSWH